VVRTGAERERDVHAAAFSLATVIAR
jgi:hypothetical protein